MIKHVLRNCIAPIMVFTVTLVADAIIFEASLTFIGAGIQEPTATWGNILADASRRRARRPLVAGAVPGLAIMITCLALNILSEGITDAMAAAPSAALDPTDSSKRREADLLVSDPVRAYKEQAQSLSARLGALRDVELKRDDRHVPDESVEPILRSVTSAFSLSITVISTSSTMSTLTSVLVRPWAWWASPVAVSPSPRWPSWA